MAQTEGPPSAAMAPETAGGVASTAELPGNCDAMAADTDRFGRPQTDGRSPIQAPENLVSDPVWGVNNTAGGPTPAAPEVPVTKGM